MGTVGLNDVPLNTLHVNLGDDLPSRSLDWREKRGLNQIELPPNYNTRNLNNGYTQNYLTHTENRHI